MLGCDVGELRRAKKAGCDGFKSNRVYLDKVSKWLADNPPPAEDESKEGLERRKLRAQCLKLEHELAVTQGEYIHRDDYESDAIRVADLVRTELLAFHADQVTWEGLPAVERDKRGKECVRRTMENLKRALSR
jgi:hypothetical protein